MTKKLFISFGFCVGLSLLSLCVFHLTLLLGLNKWIYLSVSAVLAVTCAVLAFVLKSRFKICIFPVNAIAMGLAISALYAHLGIIPPVWQSAAIFGCASAFCLFFILILSLPVINRRPVTVWAIFALFMGAGIIAGGVVTENFAFALSAFVYADLAGFTLAAVLPSKDKDDFLKKLVIASCALVFMAVIIVLIVLSEGEFLNAIAPDAPSKKNKKKRGRL